MIDLSGLAYPLQVSPSGNLLLAINEELIRDHILSFLRTIPGERVMVLSYGTENQLFKPYDDLLTVNSLLGLRLEQWIPQATFRCESEYLDTGEVTTNIFWSLRETPNVQNTFTYTWGKL